MPTTAYGATTTAAEIVADVDLHGRRAIVTGASSGIGTETARVLASAGAEVTLAVRKIEAGRKVADEIAEKLPAGTGAVHVARLDLADPRSVADFEHAWAGPLHILVNNAGVMALPQLTRTPAGYEMQFATNHLGHFALTTGLHRWLADADGAATVQWMLTHLPLTLTIAAMGAAMVGLVEHAHDGRIPVATNWVLCAGVAIVLCTTMVIAASEHV